MDDLAIGERRVVVRDLAQARGFRCGILGDELAIDAGIHGGNWAVLPQRNIAGAARRTRVTLSVSRFPTGHANIRDWLCAHGLERYADAFAANDVDLDVVPLARRHGSGTTGLSLGHRKRFRQAVATLTRPSPDVAEAGTPAGAPHSR